MQPNSSQNNASDIPAQQNSKGSLRKSPLLKQGNLLQSSINESVPAVRNVSEQDSQLNQQEKSASTNLGKRSGVYDAQKQKGGIKSTQNSEKKQKKIETELNSIFNNLVSIGKEEKAQIDDDKRVTEIKQEQANIENEDLDEGYSHESKEENAGGLHAEEAEEADEQSSEQISDDRDNAANQLKTRGISMTRERRKNIKSSQNTFEDKRNKQNELKKKKRKEQKESGNQIGQKESDELLEEPNDAFNENQNSKQTDAVIIQQANTPQILDLQQLNSFEVPLTSKNFLYKPFILLPDLTDLIGKTIEVRVHKAYITKFNRAVQQRQFFFHANDFYSSDSDMVCILQHQGKINLTEQEPTEYEGISIYFKVTKTRNNYPTSWKNGIRSQRKEKYEGNSIKFEGCRFLKDSEEFGDEQELRAMASIMPNKIENRIIIKRVIKQNQKKKIQISKLADVAKRAVWPAIVFNLSNEPAFKFNLCVFGDKSNTVQSRTSYFTRNQVIYLETQNERFEICRKTQITENKENSQEEKKEDQLKPILYTFSKVLNPILLDNEFYCLKDTKIPLQAQYKKVIADDLDWQDFHWGDYSLEVFKSKSNQLDATEGFGLYEPLLNFKFYDIKE